MEIILYTVLSMIGGVCVYHVTKLFLPSGDPVAMELRKECGANNWQNRDSIPGSSKLVDMGT